MKTWIKTTLIATIATSALGMGSALAWGPGAGPCDGDGPGPRGKMERRMDPARMQQRTETHLSKLQQALALKPEQAAAWESYKAAVLDKAKQAAARMEAMRKDGPPKTAIERMDRMEAHAKDRLQAMSDMQAATRAFYAQLDDKQKVVFDDNFPGGQLGPKGGHMRQGMGR